MHRRVIRRAAAAALALLTASSLVAFAESVVADGDVVLTGVQSTVNLGVVQPGADVPFDLSFVMTCSGTTHVDAGQNVRLVPALRSVPSGAGYSVGTLVFGVPAGWPADGNDCPAGLAPVVAGPLHIVLTAPLDPGVNYTYTFSWSRNLSPMTANDPGTFDGTNPTITFLLTVPDPAANTPPTLNLPANFTVEGSVTGGAPAAYTVSATDDQDATPPTPDCSPSVGTVLPLGTTTVVCSATDTAGSTTLGAFTITVVDTTAPVIAQSADVDTTTGNPAGVAVDYGFPSLVEAVDAHPTVGCSPASGSTFPVGTTTVTCTARDASGNQGSMSFHVTVHFVSPVTWSASWGEPVAASGSTFVANTGRTVPVKVRIFANGVEKTSGSASLTVTTCAGSAAGSMAMGYAGGRWNVSLDTGSLGGPGCYVATASLDGNAAGSFRIDLRGDATPTSNGSKGKAKP